MSDSDYWEECISEAFDDAKIKATKEQIGIVASWVEGAHENFGMAHGYDAISRGDNLEIKELKRQLEIERSKVICPDCSGRGRYITHGPCHSCDSSCFKCRGTGFLSCV